MNNHPWKFNPLDPGTAAGTLVLTVEFDEPDEDWTVVVFVTDVTITVGTTKTGGATVAVGAVTDAAVVDEFTIVGVDTVDEFTTVGIVAFVGVVDAAVEIIVVDAAPAELEEAVGSLTFFGLPVLVLPVLVGFFFFLVDELLPSVEEDVPSPAACCWICLLYEPRKYWYHKSYLPYLITIIYINIIFKSLNLQF